MEEKKVRPPPVKGYDQAYELSYKLAVEKLKATQDIAALCHKSGCELQDQRSRISVMFLHRPIYVGLPQVDITAGDAEPLSLRDKLLVLHYLTTAGGEPPTGRPVTFRELPAGPVYFPTYTKRAIKPFVDAFARDPARLLQAGYRFSATKGEAGDSSVVISAFPKVDITYVLWAGDDELPPQGNILYDANISDYLPTEDITVLTESITWQLVRS